jgi:hypothetical protein
VADIHEEGLPCWNCHNTQYTVKVDKEHGDMVYYICDQYGASSTSMKPKRKKK